MKIREINLTCLNSVGQNTLLAAEGFKIFQGENAKLLVSVPDGFDLSGAEKVRLVVKNYIGFGKVGKTTMAAKEINYSSDETIFELTPANTSAPSGLYLASVKFLDSSGKILNASSGIMELVETDCSETFTPDDDFTNVVLSARSDAVAARETARKWATEAEDKEVENGKFSASHYAAKAAACLVQIISKVAECLGYSQSAQNNANDASLSSQSALSNAQAAENSQIIAKKWASNSEDVEVESGKFSALHYAIKASASQTASAESASKAAFAQGKAEEAQGETEKLKGEVDDIVSEFNLTVNSKVLEVETAGTVAVQNVGVAKSSSINEIDSVLADAKSEITAVKDAAQTELSNQLESSKSELENWSDQTAHLTQINGNISALELGKANNGYLELNKGTVSSASVSLSLPLSFCAVLGADFANQISVGNFVLSLNSNRILTFSDGIKSISSSALTPATHAVCVAIGNDGSAKVFVDNPITPNQSGSGFVLTTSTGCVLGTSADIGSLSNFRVFNFDMSVDGAPYTVEYYMSGKPLKPGVLEARLYNADPNMGASTDGGWNNASGTKGDWTFYKGTANYEGKHLVTVNLDETDAEEVGTSCAVDFSTGSNLNYAGARVRFCNNKMKLDNYAGKKIKVHISFYAKKLSAIGSLGVSYDTTAYNSKSIKAYGVSNFNSDTWTKIDEIIEFTVDSGTYKGKSVGIFAAEGTDTNVGAYRIANFKFEVLGTALLALENYTFNGEVLDVSSNANHATVTGNVKGTNDSSIEVLYQKIASRISNATVE